MVRYSKLPFRKLVRKYNCDLTFTPMIMSDSFSQSAKAREALFSTSSDDRPLIAQFAANSVEQFREATSIIAPFCDGVDLNCGCPQRWALQEGIGASLINKPELLKDLVTEIHSNFARPEFTVSVKIRIHEDLRKTVDLVQMLESIGISWLTVHGRTVKQRAEAVNLDAIKILNESISIPVIANGDIKTLEDVNRVCEETGCAGVMSARGILRNPAMYAGFERTPLSCVCDWIDITNEVETSFTTFHHHLMYMLETILTKSERKVFNVLTTKADVLEYLNNRFELSL